jgi:predicted HTH domain antitoxin
MVTVQVQLPKEILSALRRSPDEMAGELALVVAVHCYERGLISQERAAQLAGLDRTDFILALARTRSRWARARSGENWWMADQPKSLAKSGDPIGT